MTTDGASTHIQPAPACLAPPHTLGPGPREPPAALAQSVQEEGDREGRWVVVTRSR